MKKQPILVGYNFSPSDIEEHSDRQILTLRIDTNLKCNFKCMYCAWDSGIDQKASISFDLLKETILDAKKLGAISVVIIGGGEPTLYDSYKDLILFINSNGLIPVTITNGSKITPELATFLYENNSSVAIKMDSLEKKVQERLSGVKSFNKQNESLETLLRVYGKQDKWNTRIALSFVITALNIDEIPAIWRFCRLNNIMPNPNVYNVKGRGEINADLLCPDQEKLNKIFKEISIIDVNEFGFHPINQNLKTESCLQHLYSVYIDVFGNVNPCPAVRINKFNIHQNKLSDIVESEYFKKIRETKRHLLDNNSIAMINPN